MKKNLYVSIIGIFLLTMTISITMIVGHYQDAAKQTKLYDELVQAVKDHSASKKTDFLPYSEDKNYIPEYLELHKENNDMVGWIKIDGTKLNYPVMQSIDNPNFYLRRGFDKQYTVYGCPYLQENCDVMLPSDNLVIYGHHMNDGSMFATLNQYKKESFWQNHKIISFDTLTDRNEYEIMAVFKTTVYTDSLESFKYYEFTDAKTEAEFNEYINECKKLSFYDTGVDANYGDKLITLSTCEYSQENGRLVVGAKKVS